MPLSLATSSPPEALLAKGQRPKPRIPGLLPLGSCHRGCCYGNARRRHRTEIINTHPGPGPEPGSACCLGRHSNIRRGRQRTERAARDTHSIAGLRAAGRAAAGLYGAARFCRSRALWARRARGGAGSVSPPRPNPLLPLRVESESSGSLSSQPANKTGSNWIMLFAGH